LEERRASCGEGMTLDGINNLVERCNDTRGVVYNDLRFSTVASTDFKFKIGLFKSPKDAPVTKVAELSLSEYEFTNMTPLDFASKLSDMYHNATGTVWGSGENKLVI
jgi:hypothetical protein